MEPHEHDPHSPGNEVPSPEDSGARETQYSSGEVEAVEASRDRAFSYDPAAAFIDENVRYGESTPDVVYVDPNQAYVDPNQAYYDPGQAYADPGQAYVDPGQAYVDPGQAYVDPGQAYADPGQAYVDPNQQYYAGHPVTEAQGGVYDDAPTPAPVRASVPSSRPQEKKVPRRLPNATPLVPRRVAAGSEYRRPTRSDGGLSFMSVMVMLLALAMLVGVVMVLLPRDMSNIAGYPASSIPVPNPRNLLDEAQKIMIERNELLILSEDVVNQYLNRRLQGSQKGALASIVKFKGIYVDFSPGIAEIVVEREIFGKSLTMSSLMTAEKSRKGLIYRPVGWTLGRVDLGNRTVKPVVQMFMRLRSSCLEEFQTLQQMSEVMFEENSVVLNPVIK